MRLFWITTDQYRIATMPRPRGGDWLADDIAFVKKGGIQVIVSALTPGEIAELGLIEEEQHCVQQGLKYFTFPIKDRSVPIELAEFRRFIDKLDVETQAGLAIAIHCRAGIGRSSLIAACLLIRRGFLAEEAFCKIEEARGLPVPDTPEQRAWIVEFSGRSTTF
ncbi:MAG TPA: dual specificity protein phosphatase family protein [Candidatus Limnocylindrales bacterium]|jgi:protein-tyrosine phosphatase|nr:dual specificity protein phosphatase family protein [Candidatus Limnocylindrales bacterium]